MDDTEPTPTRRRLLRSVPPAAAAVGVAGCSGSGGGGGSTPTPTPGPTATATPTATPDPPPLEQRTFQRDRPAVKHVRALASGTLTWPTLVWGNDVDQAVLGVWEAESGRLTLRSDGTYESVGPDSRTTGAYRSVRDELQFDPDEGSQFSYRYAVATEGSSTLLDLSRGGERQFRFTRSETLSDERSVLQVYRDLQALPAADGSTERASIRAGASGSGFVVSPEGHLVTNAHVVGAHESPERRLFTRHARISQEAIRESIASEESLSASQKEAVGEILYDKIVSYYARQGSFSDVTESVEVLNRRTTETGDVSADTWAATVEAEGTVVTEVDGEPSWGRDVAVLKVDERPLQTVTLGSSSSLSTGAEIFVVGYPSVGVSDLFEDDASALTPSLTSGVVSARRTLNSGVESIQTDAAINSGNSGGPMYDADGEVVGIATFGPSDVAIEQIQFGLPVETATAFLDQLGVENTSSEMEATFEAGLEAYWRGDCETATAKMEAVLEAAPHHPTAREFVADCEAGRAPGQG